MSDWQSGPKRSWPKNQNEDEADQIKDQAKGILAHDRRSCRSAASWLIDRRGSVGARLFFVAGLQVAHPRV
jgi:hypothetical protein